MTLDSIPFSVPIRALPMRASARPSPSGMPSRRLGSRPFYLGAALAALALLTLWPAVFLGRVRPASGLDASLWLGHETIFGCFTAVVVGFLFTAGKTWRGRATPRGPALAALALLWVAGRLAGLFAPGLVFLVVDASFLAIVALVFTAPILRSHDWRKAPVAIALTMLATVNLVFHIAVTGGLAELAMRPLHAALALLVALVVLVVATGRPARHA